MLIICRQTGAITTLGRKAAQPSNDLVWVSEHSPMPQLMYSTYNESDFNVIWDEYAYFQPVQDWFKKDLGKPGASGTKFLYIFIDPKIKIKNCMS